MTDRSENAVQLSRAADNLGAYVDRVRIAHVHITLIRRETPAAMLVDLDWYARAVAAIGGPETTP